MAVLRWVCSDLKLLLLRGMINRTLCRDAPCVGSDLASSFHMLLDLEQNLRSQGVQPQLRMRATAKFNRSDKVYMRP